MAGMGDVSGDTSACKHANGVSLQILGSGGPIADDGRASAGYLVWLDGKSRFMIDAGGGTFLRFGQTGASFEDLSHIAISHFHTDHSADLAPLLKSGFFSERTASLSISGPGGGGPYPSLDKFLKRMLGTDTGAYAYLSGYLDGSAGLVKLETSVVDPAIEKAYRVYSDPDNDLEVLAIGVPHGPVPALAYRVKVGRQSIVFSGDQNGSSEAFIDFARGADVLVMHMPVPEGVSGVGRRLHAPPSVIGDIATASGAGKLVLSHFMARSLKNIEENLKIVQSRYAGPVVSSNDLECVNL
jgi:ribonuclease BN (tRNA processing enzyme)